MYSRMKICAHVSQYCIINWVKFPSLQGFITHAWILVQARWLIAPVCNNNRTTTNPHNPLYVWAYCTVGTEMSQSHTQQPHWLNKHSCPAGFFVFLYFRLKIPFWASFSQAMGIRPAQSCDEYIQWSIQTCSWVLELHNLRELLCQNLHVCSNEWHVSQISLGNHDKSYTYHHTVGLHFSQNHWCWITM